LAGRGSDFAGLDSSAGCNPPTAARAMMKKRNVPRRCSDRPGTSLQSPQLLDKKRSPHEQHDEVGETAAASIRQIVE
jgi:hypothetical protein